MPKAEKYVFIVHHYAEKCRQDADLLAWILKQRSIPTMYGENLGGQKPSDEIARRIESARLIIALLTRDVKIGEDVYQPSQWALQEVTWAIAHHLPCLLVVEDGVKFDGGIAGDFEQIRFAPGDFASTLQRVTEQVTTLLNNDVVIPHDLPGDNLSDRVWRLIVEARAQAEKGRFENVLRLSDEALELDSTTWRAALNKGVALVKLGQLSGAEQVFLDMVKTFDDNGQAKAMAYNNLGWREQVSSGGQPQTSKSLQTEAMFYEAALAAMHSMNHTRASLIQCKILLEEVSDASTLLMQSLNYHGFPEALRYETLNRGYLGHQILRQLPESVWLYPILFPMWHATDDELREKQLLVLN